MTMKLHISNVPLDATEEALRAHFSKCGGVADVELVCDHASGRPRGLAHVTMTNDFYTERALTLDGASFGSAVLRVSTHAHREGRAPAPSVKIVQQFRERLNMAYDLDCAGSPLTLRISRGERGRWNVEARSTDAADAIVASGTADTGDAALAEALRAWNVAAQTSPRRAVDTDAVARAMRDVRAI
jgi:hypothetical protein